MTRRSTNNPRVDNAVASIKEAVANCVRTFYKTQSRNLFAVDYLEGQTECMMQLVPSGGGVG